MDDPFERAHVSVQYNQTEVFLEGWQYHQETWLENPCNECARYSASVFIPEWGL